MSVKVRLVREVGMALEAIQAQAGHASILTTRIYFDLSNDWLAGEYQRAMAILDNWDDEGNDHDRSGRGLRTRLLRQSVRPNRSVRRRCSQRRRPYIKCRNDRPRTRMSAPRRGRPPPPPRRPGQLGRRIG